MRMRRLMMAGLVAAMAAGVAAPAFADDWGHRGGREHEWRGHAWREQAWRERAWREHEWREYHRWGPPVVVTPGYGYYTAPGYYR
jgi:hypothetical protein